MNTSTEAEPLDDRDEFYGGGLPYGAFWALIGSAKTVPLSAGLGPVYIHDREFKKELKERAPELFAHQRAFLDLCGVGEVSEGVRAEGRARKGQPKPRNTPFLTNSLRTTPETAKYLPSRQHSRPIPLISNYRRDRVLGPFFLETEILF